MVIQALACKCIQVFPSVMDSKNFPVDILRVLAFLMYQEAAANRLNLLTGFHYYICL